MIEILTCNYNVSSPCFMLFSQMSEIINWQNKSCQFIQRSILDWKNIS